MEEDIGESKKVEAEEEKVQIREERKVEEEIEMMPKDNNITGVKSEEKRRGEDDDKVRVEQESQTKEKSLKEEGEAHESKEKGKGSHKEDPIPTAAITEENEQENPDESSKLINNADQMAAPKPDDVILSIEEETQAGSSESIINLDESATDSRCSRIKASISTCFSCIGRIPSCISTCFTCEHRSLCW